MMNVRLLALFIALLFIFPGFYLGAIAAQPALQTESASLQLAQTDEQTDEEIKKPEDEEIKKPEDETHNDEDDC